MFLDRAAIFSEFPQVHPQDVTWFVIADFYDQPVSGLAYFRDRLYACCCFPEDIPHQHIYVLQELTAVELAAELRLKDKFEALVGTHWSFDRAGHPLPRIIHPPTDAQRFYDEEPAQAITDLSDRPIIGWFDMLPSSPPEEGSSGLY